MGLIKVGKQLTVASQMYTVQQTESERDTNIYICIHIYTYIQREREDSDCDVLYILQEA